MLFQLIRPLSLLCFLLALFSFVRTRDAARAVRESARAERKAAEIKNMRLVTWQVAATEKKLVEIHELLETRPQHLMPSDKFSVECEIVGGEDDYSGEYLLWTTVEFLVAPVTRAYEQMDTGTLSSSVGWAQVTEMRDLKTTPIYYLRPGESQKVAISGLDLRQVLAAFPVGEDGELWPWLVRVTVHVQDRSGKQLTSAERTVRLTPSSARKKSRYSDPLPPR